MNLAFKARFIILIVIVGLITILVFNPASIMVPPIWKYSLLGLAVLISIGLFAVWEKVKRKKNLTKN